jgi:hypothetical protein
MPYLRATSVGVSTDPRLSSTIPSLCSSVPTRRQPPRVITSIRGIRAPLRLIVRASSAGSASGTKVGIASMADFHHNEITRRKVSPPNRLRRAHPWWLKGVKIMHTSGGGRGSKLWRSLALPALRDTMLPNDRRVSRSPDAPFVSACLAKTKFAHRPGWYSLCFVTPFVRAEPQRQDIEFTSHSRPFKTVSIRWVRYAQNLGSDHILFADAANDRFETMEAGPWRSVCAGADHQMPVRCPPISTRIYVPNTFIRCQRDRPKPGGSKLG